MTRQYRRVFVCFWCVLLLVLASCGDAPHSPAPIAADWLTPGFDPQGWPTFGHDSAHSGVYLAQGAAPLRGQVAWQRNAGGGIFSSPILADGILYVGSTSGNLAAMDARTGRVFWQHRVGQYLNDTTPVIVGRVVFVAANRSWVLALDRTNGQQLWAVNLGEVIQAPPAYADGLVLVNARTTTFALDARTGNVKWRFHERGEGWPTQMAPAVFGSMVYITQGTTNTVYALSLSSGHQMWSHDVGDRLISSPLVAGQQVVVGTWNGHVEALDATTGAPHWGYNVNQALKPGSPQDGIAGSPASAGDLLFIGTYSGNVLALGLRDGQLKWTQVIDAAVLDVPAVAGNTLYISGGQAVYALSTTDGTQRWRLAIGEVRSGLALGPGHLYAATVQGYVYAVG